MTSFDEIIDIVLLEIRDYNLDKLYSLSPTDFSTLMDGLLLKSLPYFDNCKQNLDDYNTTNRTFNIILTSKEKSIIAKWMVIQWFLKEIQDITQFNNFLSDTDFKMYSNANNLREKSEYYNRLREIVNQDMVQYGLKNIPWSDWQVGNFQ